MYTYNPCKRPLAPPRAPSPLRGRRAVDQRPGALADGSQGQVPVRQQLWRGHQPLVIAALVGANGLGVPVIRALNSVNTALGFESGFIIVVVAVLLDRILRVK